MSLIKNSILNLGGFIIPTLIAIPSLGFLARVLGPERFGLFTLVFAIVGYASIFDAGLSRAVVREISIFRDEVKEQQAIISTATICIFFLGGLAGCIIFFISPYLAEWLNVSDSLKSEAIYSFKILSFIIPVFLLNQIWTSYIEGMEFFATLNIQRVISNSSIAAFPAVAMYFSQTLTATIFGVLAGRFLSVILSFFFSRNIILGSKIFFKKSTFQRLIQFGGWITVSNVISPIMVYFDRFIISNIMGADRIAFYTAPSEAVARLLNVPVALSKALFPRLSYVKLEQDKKKIKKLSYIIMLFLCLPLALFCFVFSNNLMVLWMGNDYSGEPGVIFKILLIGFFFNSLAQIPFSELHAKGRAKWTAVLHSCELIPYLIILYFLTKEMFLIGAAIAWSVRVTFDFFMLFILERKKYD